MDSQSLSDAAMKSQCKSSNENSFPTVFADIKISAVLPDRIQWGKIIQILYSCSKNDIPCHLPWSQRILLEMVHLCPSASSPTSKH